MPAGDAGAATRKHQTKNIMITWAHMYLKEKQTLYACLKPIATTRGSARSLISIAHTWVPKGSSGES
jgi:hypothetical protein